MLDQLRDLFLVILSVLSGIIVNPITGIVCIVTTKEIIQCLKEMLYKQYLIIIFSVYYIILVIGQIIILFYKIIRSCIGIKFMIEMLINVL